MIRTLLAFLLISGIFSAPAWADYTLRANTRESAVKHVLTGGAAGAGGMGVCLEASEHKTLLCSAIVGTASVVVYGLKERYDSKTYGNPFDLRDFLEGTVGSFGGITFMGVLAEF